MERGWVGEGAPSCGQPCLPVPNPVQSGFSRDAQARFPILPLGLSALLLLWPALRNGYPIVFDDTGTYLSQAVHRYLGWDRPVFYSLFLFPLHLTLTTWPDVAAQALLAAFTLHLVRRRLAAGRLALVAGALRRRPVRNHRAAVVRLAAHARHLHAAADPCAGPAAVRA